MKKKNIYIALSIMLFLSLAFVLADQLTTFTNSLTAENLSFSGSQNTTRNLSIYRYSNVTSAYINLSGYDIGEGTATGAASAGFRGSFEGMGHNGTHVFICDQSTDDVYVDLFDGTDVNSFDTTGDGQTNLRGCDYGNGYVWTVDYTGGGPSEIFKWTTEGVYQSNFVVDAANGVPLDIAHDGTYLYVTDNEDDKVYKYNEAGVLQTSFAVAESHTITTDGTYLWIGDYINTDNIYKYWINGTYITSFPMTPRGDAIMVNGTYFWRGNSQYYMSSFPADTFINVNGTNIWSFTGELNATDSPNKTADFSSTLNTALNSGACDCPTCTLDGNNCIIPFIFHSDAIGKIGYDDINIQYDKTYTVNHTATTQVNKLDLTNTTYNGRTAQPYTADTQTSHNLIIEDDSKDHYLVIVYSELNAVLDILVNSYAIGTIPADAGSSGTWKGKVFDVSSAYLLTNNVIRVDANVANGDTGYIDKMYLVSQDELSSAYAKNSTTIALHSNISDPIPNYMSLNQSYDNSTAIHYEGLDTNLHHNTSFGNIITIFETEQYEGVVNLTIRANSTLKADIIETNVYSLTIDKTIPSFNTITTNLSNILAGRTYDITLNQTESNPNYVEVYLNSVLKSNLTQNATDSMIWEGNVSYTQAYTSNLTLKSYDLAGNTYNYTVEISVSTANTTQATPVSNTSYHRTTNYKNTSTADTYYNETLKTVLTINTEGSSYLDDYSVNVTINDTYPYNIYHVLSNASVTATHSDNDTNPSWTTDAFNNTESATLSFTNDLIYDIQSALRLKHADAGAGDERLFWALTNNLTTNLTDVWFRIPIRTAFSGSTHSIQMKVCSAGHTYGQTTCTNWAISTTTFYSQTDETYNGGTYPTSDEDGDGNKDYIRFKVPSISPSETIMYSFDTILTAEPEWAINPGGSGGGGSSDSDEEQNDTIIDDDEDKDGGGFTTPSWIGNTFKSIGSFLDSFIIQPIKGVTQALTFKFDDRVGFFVVSALVLVSGVILFLSGTKSQKGIKREGFRT